MMNRTSRRQMLVACGLISACSSEPTNELVGNNATPVVAGAIGVTGIDPITAPERQTESVIAIASYGQNPPDQPVATEIDGVITYNDFTNTAGPGGIDTSVTPACIHPGVSLTGWSRSSTTVANQFGNSWVYEGKVPGVPPNGWTITWGDPSIANSRAHQWNFFISNLAVHITNSQIANFGCVNDIKSALAGACIARSVDNGQTFNWYQCLSSTSDQGLTPGDFYDGSTLATGIFGEVYAGYRDVTTGEAHVFEAPNENASFAKMPLPFKNGLYPYKIITHVRLRVDYINNEPYLMTTAQLPNLDQRLIITRFHRGQWTPPVEIPRTATFPNKLQLSDRAIQMGAGAQFSFDIGAPSVDPNGVTRPDDVRIMFTTVANDGRMAIEGAYCDRALSACFNAPEWSSEVAGPSGQHTGEQINPNVVAFAGWLPWYVPSWKTSYMTTDANPNGNVLSVQQGNLNYVGFTRFFAVQASMAPQTPCTGPGTAQLPAGSWSDYDDMALGYLTPSDGEVFVRSFPDSTGAACYDIGVSTAKPQHTSIVKISL